MTVHPKRVLKPRAFGETPASSSVQMTVRPKRVLKHKVDGGNGHVKEQGDDEGCAVSKVKKSC